MAFIIPMLGRSSRFFNEGYSVPKYQLQLSDKSTFFHAISSFEKYFRTDLFIFLVRSDYDADVFVKDEIRKSSINSYKIKVVEYETNGQAESVNLALDFLEPNEPIYIFNIDTFRNNFTKPEFIGDCDGYLEVFIGDGDGWSFILPGDGNKVLKTTEKDRVSNLCSDGLYYFKNKMIFSAALKNAKASKKTVNGEYYIAPLYNELIKEGRSVCYNLLDISELEFFGTPKEYIEILTKYKQF